MAKLIFMFDGNVLGEYELNKERMTIGRRPSNDIHIDNLAVSGEHAVVVTLDGDSFLEDLNSTNGTFVNKKRVKKHVLQHQDVIELGKYQLKFLGQSAQQNATQSGFAHTVMVTPAVPISRPVPLPQAPLGEIVETLETETEVSLEDNDLALSEAKPNRPKPMEMSLTEQVDTMANLPKAQTTVGAEQIQQEPPDAKIKVMSGSDSGVELRLNKTMVKLGRHGEQLAVVTKRPNGYYITHVDGKTRAIVNGEPIGVHAQPLNNGDFIEIAGDKMQFVYELDQ
jgi:pSer/pThr/pTyr-binding forkhead associated (FHA) protein